MKFLSVCAGIEAASVAWLPLGFECVGLSEVDPFARSVLRHRYPETPLFGDFTRLEAHHAKRPDILVGGTPCQSFSVSGHREGLNDERGNLALEFVRLAARLESPWVVWENVPGVLSVDNGRAFGAFLRSLADSGYRCAWRVLDAQHFGVAQRRRRVFLVGYAGTGPHDPARVLFEPPSVQRHTRTSKPSRPEAPRGVEESSTERGEPIVFDPAQCTHPENRARVDPGAPVGCLAAGGRKAVAWSVYPASGQGADLEASHASHASQITAAAGAKQSDRGTRISSTLGVRRLTPREWERLQGFPDDWTRIPWPAGQAVMPWAQQYAPKSLRYRAIGNSIAVPVLRWIGERLQQEARQSVEGSGATPKHVEGLEKII